MGKVKKTISIILSVLIILSCIDVQAFAARIVQDDEYVASDEKWLTVERLMNGNTYTEETAEQTYIRLSAINGKLNMPVKGEYCDISWTSDNESVVTTDGTIVQPPYLEANGESVNVTLKATLCYGGATSEKTFYIIVPPSEGTDAEIKVMQDCDALKSYLGSGYNNVYLNELNTNMSLPTIISNLPMTANAGNGSAVTWESGDTSLLTIETQANNGYVTGIVNRPSYTEGDKALTLIARVSQSDAVYKDLTFDITVKAKVPDSSESVAYIKNGLTYELILSGNSQDNVKSDLNLPNAYGVPSDYGYKGYTISWTTSDSNAITAAGKVIRPAEGTKTVTLTANILDGGSTVGTKEFTVTVTSIEKSTLALKFDDFSNAGNILQANGKSGINDSDSKALSFVNNGAGGSIFTKNKIHLNDDLSFSTAFSFKINADEKFGNYGDGGFTFTLQSDSSTVYYIGDDTDSFGIKGIKPSISIEFDTEYSESQGSGQVTNYNALKRLGVFTNGNTDSLIENSEYSTLTSFSLGAAGTVSYAWVEYDGTSKALEIRVSESQTRPYNAICKIENIDLVALLAADNNLSVGDVQNIYAGFTGSAGDMSSEEDDILSWYFKNDSTPIDFDHHTYADASVVAVSVSANGDVGDCTISAAVSGNDGTATEDIPVVFSASNGTLESSLANTDSSGKASVIMHTAESISGVEVHAVAEGGMIGSATFDLALTPQYVVDYDAERLTDSLILNGNSSLNNVITDLFLPTEGQVLYNDSGSEKKSTISWVSSNETFLTNDGKVTNPSPEDGDQTITLRATVTLGEASTTKEFKLNIKTKDTADVNADSNWLDSAILKDNSALENIKTNLNLPTTGQHGSSISWVSSDTNVVNTDGTVTNPAFADGNKKVVLTATISKGDVIVTKQINITVKSVDASDAEAVPADASWLESVILNGNMSFDSIISDLNLPSVGPNGSTIIWTSSDGSTVSTEGKVTPPTYLDGDKSVILTATLTKGDESSEKTIKLTVKKLGGTEAEKFEEDVNWADASVTLGNNLSQYSIYLDLVLPDKASNGSAITWASSDTSVITDAGTVTRPEYKEKNAAVTMIATISGFGSTTTKNIEYTVLSEPDLYPPEVTGSEPSNGSTEINYRTKEITITFNENIQGGTSNNSNYGITLKGGRSNPDYTVGITGNTLIITIAYLSSGGNYKLTIPKDAITDILGNQMAEDYILSFTIETAINKDILVVSSTPSDGSKNIVDSSISLSFAYENGSEIKDSANLIASGNFNGIYLKEREGSIVKITRELDGNTIKISPADEPLKPGGVYTLSIPSNAVLDKFNNENRSKTIQFAVASTDAMPEVSAIYPANGQTGVNVNQYIIVTFSENVKNGLGGIALRDNSNNNSVTNDVHVYTYWLNDRQCLLRPLTVLKPGTSYTLEMSHKFVKDSSSNSMLDDYKISFATGSNALGIESVSPLTTRSTLGSPIDAAVNIDLSASAVLTDKAADITISNSSGSTVAFQAASSGSKVVLTPSSLLNAGESYTVSVPEGAFISESGDVNDAITFSIVTGSKVSLDSNDAFIPYPSANWIVNKAMTFKTDSLAKAFMYGASRSIRSCSWSFGDGTTGNGNSPEHTYTSVGSYTVTLSVEDDYGFTYELSQTVKIGNFNSENTSFSVSPSRNERLNISDSGNKYKLYTVSLVYDNTYVPGEKINVYLYKNGVNLKCLGSVTTGDGSKTLTDDLGYRYSDYGKTLFDFWFAGNNYLGTYELVFTYGDADMGKSVRVPVTIVDDSSTPALTIKLYDPSDGTYHDDYSRLCFELDGEKVIGDKEWVNDDLGYCYVVKGTSTGFHNLCLSSSGNTGLWCYSDTSNEYHSSATCPVILNLNEKRPGINRITSSDGSSSDSHDYLYYITGVERPETEFTIEGDWDDLNSGYYEYKVSGSDGDRYKRASSSPNISLDLPSLLSPGDKLYFRMVSESGAFASDWKDAGVLMIPQPEDGSTTKYNPETNSYDVSVEFKLKELLEETPNIFDGIPFLEDDENLAELSKTMFTVTAYSVDGKSRFIKYDFPDELAEMISEGMKFPVQISGKIILKYKESSNKWELYYGYITLKRDSTLKSSGEKKITIPVVDVSVTGELKLSLVLGASLVINKSEEVNYDYGGVFYIEPKLEGDVSTGVGRFKISCFTEASISSQIHTTGYASVSATASAGVKAKAWFISKTLFKLSLVDKTWDNGGTPILMSAHSMMNELSGQPSEITPRAYLQRGSEWTAPHMQPTLMALASSATDKTDTMKTNIFPDSAVQLVSYGDELWMIWTDDNPDRSSMNRTQLTYSVYQNGSWSAPAWIGPDGTADFNPSAAITDNGVLMAWENMGIELPDNTEASDFAANSEISVTKSEFTSDDASQPETVTLTNDDQYDHSPKLAASGESALLVWIKSKELSGTCFDNNTQDKNTDGLYYSDWDGESWSTASELEGSLSTVVDSSLAMNNNGDGLLLYTLDSDGDITTTNDQELHARVWKEGMWGEAEKLADTAVNPKAIYVNGDWFITWNQDGGVMYQAGLADSAENLGLQAGDDYEITASDGTVALVYTEIGDNNTKSLSAAFYDTSAGIWSGKTALTDDDNSYVQSLNPVFMDNGTLSVAYTQAEMVTESIDGGEYQVPSDKVDLKKLDYTLKHNLVMDSDAGLVLDPEMPLPGIVETVTATVLNKGDFTENATVYLYDGDPADGGTLVAQAAPDAPVPAHSSSQVEIKWNVNSDQKDKYELYAVVKAEDGIMKDKYELSSVAKADDGITKSDMSVNSVSKNVSTADAEITDVECTNVANGSYLVRATVYNSGSKDLSNVVLALTCGGKTLGTVTIDKLYSGEKNGVDLVFSSKDLTANESESFDMELTASLAAGVTDNSPDNNTYAFTAEPASIVIKSFNPAPGDTKVDVNKAIRVTINMDVLEGTAFNQITLRDENLNEVQISKTLSDDTLTITPKAALDYETQYTLIIPADAVGDSYGHAMGEDCTISFNTTTSSPEIVFSYPGANMEDMLVNAKIKIKYNQSVSEGPSFNIISLCADSKTVPVTATTDGEWLYINPADGLEKGTEYSLEIPSGSVINSSYGIQQENYTLTFDTEGTKEINVDSNNYSGELDGYTITHQTLSNGLVEAVISFDSDYIAQTESAGTATATVNVTSKVTNDDSIRISLTKAAEDRLISDNMALRIITGKGDITIPAAWFTSLHAEGRNSITLTITPASGDGTMDGMVSDGIYIFILTAGGQQITKLGENFTITIPLDKSKFKNTERVIARTYDETSGSWQALGGVANKESATLTFRTSHFSSYAAFENSKAFEDVTSDWAKNDIETLASRGLINGTSDSMFNPDGNITRGEFTTLIVRSLYMNFSESKGTFTDVSADSWYAEAVETAYDLGLVTGIGENTFDPDANITREQLAVIAYRLYQYKNGTAAGNTEITFSDSQNISEYARAAANFVQNTGIMKGSDNIFYPKRNTTRQEAAVVLYRLLKYKGEI